MEKLIIAHDVVRSGSLPAEATMHYAAEGGGTGRTVCGRTLRHWAVVSLAHAYARQYTICARCADRRKP